MRMTFATIGLLALAGAGLVMAAGNPQPQQPAAARSPTGAQPQRKPAPSPEEKAIIDGVNAFSSLYSAANAEALAELFLDDASIIDPDGNETRGKAAVAEMYAGGVSGEPGTQSPVARSTRSGSSLRTSRGCRESRNFRRPRAMRRSSPGSMPSWSGATANGRSPRFASPPLRPLT